MIRISWRGVRMEDEEVRERISLYEEFRKDIYYRDSVVRHSILKMRRCAAIDGEGS